jgi:hypothetical protein
LIIGLAGGGFLLLVMVIVIVVLCLPSGPKGDLVTKENVAKIKPNMTQSEVEGILGPGKDVTNENAPELARVRGMGGGLMGLIAPKIMEWNGNGHKVLIIFMAGKVVDIRHDF